MSTKSTGNGVNSAVARRGVYSSANASLGRPPSAQNVNPFGRYGIRG
jgi:hypothetical protein